jgi:hypothetical protein
VIDEGAFQRAGTPGRGSAVGDFVPGKNGGFVPRNHPDAMVGESTPSKASLPTEEVAAPQEAAAPAAPAAMDGGTYDPSSIGGMAMSGLQQAREPVEGARSLPMPGAVNPLLGQRIYPMALRQLSEAGRFY